MVQASREQEAEMRRARAGMIRRHVQTYGQAMGLESQLSWLGVAEAEERLAEALSLPAFVPGPAV